MIGIIQPTPKRILSVVLLIFLCLQSAGFSQTSRIPNREFRDLLGKNGLTERDKRDFCFLDKILLARDITPKDVDSIVEILEFSNSRDVVIHALTTIACLPTIPEKIMKKVAELSRIDDDVIKMHLAIFLGKLAIPSTFPILINLVKEPRPPYIELLVLSRFGIESIAAIPFLTSFFGRIPKEHLSKIIKFYLRISIFCISLSAIGAAFPIFYSVPQIPDWIFDSLKPQPMWPQVEKVFDTLKKQKQY